MKKESKKKLRSKIKCAEAKQKRTRSSFDFTKLAEALKSAEPDVANNKTLVNVYCSDNFMNLKKNEEKTEKNSVFDFSEFREELLATGEKVKVDEEDKAKNSAKLLEEALVDGDKTIERLKVLTMVAAKRNRTASYHLRRPITPVYHQSHVMSRMGHRRSAQTFWNKDWEDPSAWFKYYLDIV